MATFSVKPKSETKADEPPQINPLALTADGTTFPALSTAPSRQKILREAVATELAVVMFRSDNFAKTLQVFAEVDRIEKKNVSGGIAYPLT